MSPARSLRSMPKIERDRIIEQAAKIAADDYAPGGSLDLGTGFFSDEDQKEETEATK